MDTAPSPYTLVGYAGIDVSNHQNPKALDWNKVKQWGAVWAYIKATEGQDYSDPSSFEHAVRAQDAGVTVGYYHFARPDSIKTTVEDDAKAEAEDFLKALDALPKGGLPPVLDWERDAPNLDKDQMASWALTFLQTLQNAGTKTPVVYTGYYHMQETTRLDPAFTNYALWQPWYRPGRNPWDGPPTVAEPWKTWSVYQYTDQGIIPGYDEGTLDLNVATREFLLSTLELPDLVYRNLV